MLVIMGRRPAGRVRPTRAKILALRSATATMPARNAPTSDSKSAEAPTILCQPSGGVVGLQGLQGTIRDAAEVVLAVR
jgi:hypothetical protein